MTTLKWHFPKGAERTIPLAGLTWMLLVRQVPPNEKYPSAQSSVHVVVFATNGAWAMSRGARTETLLDARDTFAKTYGADCHITCCIRDSSLGTPSTLACTFDLNAEFCRTWRMGHDRDTAFMAVSNDAQSVAFVTRKMGTAEENGETRLSSMLQMFVNPTKSHAKKPESIFGDSRGLFLSPLMQGPRLYVFSRARTYTTADGRVARTQDNAAMVDLCNGGRFYTIGQIPPNNFWGHRYVDNEHETWQWMHARGHFLWMYTGREHWDGESRFVNAPFAYTNTSDDVSAFSMLGHTNSDADTTRIVLVHASNFRVRMEILCNGLTNDEHTLISHDPHGVVAMRVVANDDGESSTVYLYRADMMQIMGAFEFRDRLTTIVASRTTFRIPHATWTNPALVHMKWTTPPVFKF